MNEWHGDAKYGDKYYQLCMFPYPSGNLHIGHWYAICPADAHARFKKMQGYNVFFPMGFDAFGLPAENAAIKHGVDPEEWTRKNIERMRGQLRSMNCMFPWRHEVITCDPDYYKWSQWLFLKFYENDLVYKADEEVDFCPACQTTLAKEQAKDGVCDRCDSRVEQRAIPHWKIRLTKYADELRSFDGLDWPGNIKSMQKEWIDNLRDWNISRQRAWGTPIPLVYCGKCGIVPARYGDLPVTVNSEEDMACPKCQGQARREMDTMDTFFDSSWYQYAYLAARWDLKKKVSEHSTPWEDELIRRWCPVDLYTGGIEHACMHLIYFRFFTKALADIGYLNFREPATRLFSQGTILGNDHQKMAKSRGNVIDPDELVEKYGADAVRAYLMFMGPWDQGASWNAEGIQGVVRFLKDVEAMSEMHGNGEACDPEGWSPKPKQVMDRRGREITEAYKSFRFNVAIAHMMSVRNAMFREREELSRSQWDNMYLKLLLMLAPICPEMTDRLWRKGPWDSETERQVRSIHLEEWPEFDPVEDTVDILIQVDGRNRTVVRKLDRDNTEDVLNYPEIKKVLEGVDRKRVIVVPNKLINVLTGNKRRS